MLDGIRQATPHDDAAKRDWSSGLSVPELAEIDDLLQSLRLVRKTVLVNDEPGVELIVQQRRLDRRKQQRRLVARLRKRKAEQEICGRVDARNGDPEPT